MELGFARPDALITHPAGVGSAPAGPRRREGTRFGPAASAAGLSCLRGGARMRTRFVLRGAPGSGKTTQSRQHGLADGSSPREQG